jgi:anti-sigma-K factor RskA
MITDFQEEQACFYVLGLLPEGETAAFEAEMRGSTELSALVASLNNATLSLARSAPPQELPAQAKQRLLAAIARPTDQIIPFPARKKYGFVPWAAAACLAGLLYWQTDRGSRENQTLTQTISDQNTVLLTTREKADRFEKQLVQTNQDFAEKLAAAESTRRDLLTRLSALEQKDFLAQAKIAVMSSLLKERPQAVAVSLWDQEKQNGLLVVENLPVLDAGKDYQLWVLDPSVAAPVSAGTFKVDADGKVRISFKPDKAVPTAAKFAVTEEKEGGVLSPTMDKMVVIGGV